MNVCPRCKTDNIRKFSIVYDEGSLEGSSQSQSTHSSSHSEGGWSSGHSSGTSTFKSQSYLAQKCSPPNKPYPSTFFHITAIILSFYMLSKIEIIFPLSILNFLKSLDLPKLLLIFSILLIFMGIIYFLRYLIYSKSLWNKYNKDIKYWHKSWICLKCGEDFFEKNN